MALKASDMMKKKKAGKKDSKTNSLIDWIGKRRNSTKKGAAKAKGGAKDDGEEDEE